MIWNISICRNILLCYTLMQLFMQILIRSTFVKMLFSELICSSNKRTRKKIRGKIWIDKKDSRFYPSYIISEITLYDAHYDETFSRYTTKTKKNHCFAIKNFFLIGSTEAVTSEHWKCWSLKSQSSPSSSVYFKNESSVDSQLQRQRDFFFAFLIDFQAICHVFLCFFSLKSYQRLFSKRVKELTSVHNINFY